MSIRYTLHVPEASFRAFAPLIAAECNGVEIEIKTDLAAAALSPTGKLPLLEITKSGGAVTRLFSAQAIARYMGGIRTDTGLMGNGNHARASIDAWIDFSAQDMELPACIWFYPVTGYMPFHSDAYEKAKVDLAAGLTVLEKHLAAKTDMYLVGEELTLADICVVSVLLYPFKLVCDKSFLAPFPTVVKWFQNCVGQPEFRAIIGNVAMCKKETLAPGQSAPAPAPAAPKIDKTPPAAAAATVPEPAPAPAPVPAPATPEIDNTPPAAAPVPEPEPAPAPAGDDMQDRRMVAMAIKPVDGVDPLALYTKIKTEIVSQPEYLLKWDDNCKVENGKIYASFTIAVAADYDEEVCEMIEMMEDEVAGQEVTFMNVFE